jgi:hypothetical protein
MTDLQRFAPPKTHAGDYTGRVHQANIAAEEDNTKAREVAIDELRRAEEPFRYVRVPGRATPYPVPKDLYDHLQRSWSR